MTRRKRRYHSPEFKAKVTIAASRGDRTQAELSQQFEVYVRTDKDWKAQQPECSAVEFWSETGEGFRTGYPDHADQDRSFAKSRSADHRIVADLIDSDPQKTLIVRRTSGGFLS